MLSTQALIIFHQSDLFALYFVLSIFFLQKNFGVSYTWLSIKCCCLVVQFSMSFASALADSSIIIPLLLPPVNTFFKTFLSFFHLFLPSGFCRYILCFRHTPPQNSLRSFQFLFLIFRIYWANNSRWRVFYKKYFCFLHPEKKPCDIFTAKGNSWYLHTFLCQGR